MKITKKQQSIKASEDVLIAEVPVVEEVATEVPAAALLQENVCKCRYQCALDFISSAIESLAEIAKDDPIAKDSIANLGVVMLDLKGNCC